MKRPAAAVGADVGSSRIAQAVGAESLQIAELAAVKVRTARIPGCAALVDVYSFCEPSLFPAATGHVKDL